MAGGHPASGPCLSGPPPAPRSDDERANLMWKRYLEREDSKIVGEPRRHGAAPVPRGWGGPQPFGTNLTPPPLTPPAPQTSSWGS